MKTPKHTPVSKGRPPKGNSEDRREHALNSALVLFSVQGIAGTTIAQIAKSSGVTPAMIHYYFNNREGLLDSLVKERLAPVLKHIWSAVSDENLVDTRRTITEFVDRLLDAVEKMPQLAALWSREILSPGGALRERVMPLIPLDLFEKARNAFAKAQQRGEINKLVSPALVLTSAMSIVMFHIAAQELLVQIPSVNAIQRQHLRQHVLALILDGLRPEQKKGV